jgi:hypothetical protein
MSTPLVSSIGRRAMPTMGSAEVRANSKGYGIP